MSRVDKAVSILQGEYDAIQAQVIKNIIERLNRDDLSKLNSDNVLAWQVKRLAELGDFNNQTIKQIASHVNKSHQIVSQIMVSIGSNIKATTEKELIEVTGKEPKPTSEIDYLMKNYAKMANDSLDNKINETLLTRNTATSAQAKAYRDVLQNTVAKILTGTHEPKRALADTIYQWQDSGLKTNLIDKAGRNWNVETYANMVINTAVPKAYAETVKSRMDEYNYHLIVYPEFAAAREDCARMQGRVVNTVPASDPDYDDKYDTIYNHNYGKAGGALGINCRHTDFTIFNPRDMEETKQTVKPSDAIKQEKLIQNQRRLERGIRKSKLALQSAKELGDEDAQMHYKALIRTQQAATRQYVNSHDGLVRQYQREQIVK